MRQRNIGPALEVSELCLGTMLFGTRVDEATSFAILDRFVEAGGNFLDTANCYSFRAGTGEESESLLGRWLRRRGDRDRIVVATKVGSRPEPAGAPWPEGAEGLSASVIRAQAQASLRRFDTDYIDLYYAHIDDPQVPQEETLGAFHQLVAAGAVRALGCSNHRTERIVSARRTATAHGWPTYRCVQQRHTYLTPAPGADFGAQVVADDELFAYARAEGDLVLLGYSPLLSGSYTRSDRPIAREYQHPGTADRLGALYEVADSLGATPTQVVLAWLLGGDPPARRPHANRRTTPVPAGHRGPLLHRAVRLREVTRSEPGDTLGRSGRTGTPPAPLPRRAPVGGTRGRSGWGSYPSRGKCRRLAGRTPDSPRCFPALPGCRRAWREPRPPGSGSPPAGQGSGSVPLWPEPPPGHRGGAARWPRRLRPPGGGSATRSPT